MFSIKFCMWFELKIQRLTPRNVCQKPVPRFAPPLKVSFYIKLTLLNKTIAGRKLNKSRQCFLTDYMSSLDITTEWQNSWSSLGSLEPIWSIPCSSRTTESQLPRTMARWASEVFWATGNNFTKADDLLKCLPAWLFCDSVTAGMALFCICTDHPHTLPLADTFPQQSWVLMQTPKSWCNTLGQNVSMETVNISQRQTIPACW